jgi:hypothetical protein
VDKKAEVARNKEEKKRKTKRKLGREYETTTTGRDRMRV